uniref:Inactive rhomboid protein 1-like n=1 Tax=Rhizophora mucronata TaxID=61149 RepID=A0A2P2JZD9_RHIMU
MGLAISRLVKMLFARKEMRILMVGLDAQRLSCNNFLLMGNSCPIVCFTGCSAFYTAILHNHQSCDWNSAIR